MINLELWPIVMQFAMQRTSLRIRYGSRANVLWLSECLPLWPNGEGIGLLNQGLWVRVPPRVICRFFFFVYEGGAGPWLWHWNS